MLRRSARVLGFVPVFLLGCGSGQTKGGQGGSTALGGALSGPTGGGPSSGNSGQGGSTQDGSAQAGSALGGSTAAAQGGSAQGGSTSQGGAAQGGSSTGGSTAKSCTPTCGSAQCGSDGCNGICGTCAPSKACQAGQCVAPSGAGDVTVNTGTVLHPIHAEIYGLAFATKKQIADLNVPLNRSGGNSTTRYNWQLDVHNVGADWYFENLPDDGEGTYGQSGYLSSSDVFVRDTLAAGATPLVTISTIGFTPKARKTDHPYDCGFPKTEYSNQTSYDTWDTNCGNGKTSSGDIVATANDASNTSVAVGPEDATARVKHIVDTYGASYGRRTHFYQLDNEMLAWSGTHADVHPSHTKYDEVWQKTLDYAPAIRAADSAAFIMGYGTFSTGDVLDSMASGDRAAHKDLPLMRFYLQKLAAYAAEHGGTRLIDCVDIHPYPQSGQPALDSPRDLWDPSYTDPTWINDMYSEPVRLLPRLREWIQADYPGTGICLTEYTFFPDDAHGAVIQAEVLGIFGREDVRLAAFWTVPFDDSDQPTKPYWAFRMYRNYDDKGGTFGDQAVDVATTVQNLSVFAAKRSTDQAVTVMLVNKAADTRSVTVSLEGSSAASVGVFTHVSGSNAITTGASLTPAASKVTTSVPGYAVQLLVAK